MTRLPLRSSGFPWQYLWYMDEPNLSEERLLLLNQILTDLTNHPTQYDGFEKFSQRGRQEYVYASLASWIKEAMRCARDVYHSHPAEEKYIDYGIAIYCENNLLEIFPVFTYEYDGLSCAFEPKQDVYWNGREFRIHGIKMTSLSRWAELYWQEEIEVV